MPFLFYDVDPTLDNYWRGIILFGRNVQSYKFALGASILDLANSKDDFIPLEKLADPFSRHIVRHIGGGHKQGTSRTSKFIEACKQHYKGKLSHDKIIDITTQLGFQNVIDAFHIVNGKEIPQRFFIDERDGARKGIRLTDNLFNLYELDADKNLTPEVEARWRLVETAWDLNISRRLISVNHDFEGEQFFVSHENQRVDVTSSRDSLNGYQRSKCLYCKIYVSVISGSPAIAHVDHFYPHVLKQHGINCNIDGVWNLVLACAYCNGAAGKGAKVPTPRLVTRLSKRNEYLIGSNHPLKETIIRQTGNDKAKRKAFLQSVYNEAKSILLHTWEPPQKG